MSTAPYTYILLGSCFSQHMSRHMSRQGIPHLTNPSGTLFNPESIRTTVTQALSPRRSPLPMFYDQDMGEWRCWWANTQFRSHQREECEAQVSAALDRLAQGLHTARRLFVTLGTNVCYRLREGGLTVTNCQRQADRLFQEYALTLPETTEILDDTVQTLHQANPELHITFTVSPYRYRKYGLHQSQLSKAVLHLAIDQTCRRHAPYTDYFPAYEIMIDELRDYQYYAPDGLHPSPQATEIIWNRLCKYLQSHQ